MNIGIIVFSHTGNTRSVALRLKEKLSAAGHSVKIEEIKISGSYGSGSLNFRVETAPDPGQYDAVVFGAPVLGFSLSPVMKKYLAGISSLNMKKVALLTTEFFPFPWMGGNRAIRKMKKICQSRGASVTETGVVNWSRKDREQKIIQVVDGLSRAFS